MFCIQCGAKIKDNSAFCENCGANQFSLDVDNKKECPRCHKMVPNLAKCCPYCHMLFTSSSNKEKEKLSIRLGIASVAIIMFFAFILNFLLSPSHQNSTPLPPPPSATREINFGLGIGPGYITITNNNDFDWVNARIMIPDGIIDVYRYKVGIVQRGEKRTYYLNNFINSDGKRFNWQTHVPMEIDILAENAAGSMVRK
jgi:hypothetical protein